MRRYAVFILLGHGFLAGCSQHHEELSCKCPESAGGLVHVVVPPSLQSDVASVTTSGPGCDSDVAMVKNEFQTVAHPNGVCHVEVSFQSGAPTFARDLTFSCTGGCCSICGVTGATVTIPGLDSDAGD